MSENAPQKPGTADLSALMIESRFMYLQIAQRLLDAEPQHAGWSASTVQAAVEALRQGHKIVLEIGGASGAVTVAMVAVSASGERRELGHVAEDAPSAAN